MLLNVDNEKLLVLPIIIALVLNKIYVPKYIEPDTH